MPLDLILTLIGSIVGLGGLMWANLYVWKKREKRKEEIDDEQRKTIQHKNN